MAHLETGSSLVSLVHPEGRYLLTSGAAGLHRWPIRHDDASGDSDVFHIGPPELLRRRAPKEDYFDIAWLPGCRGIAVNDPHRARVLLLDLEARESKPIVLTSNDARAKSLAVDLAGEWIAGGGFKSNAIQIWNVAERRIERTLPPSPDGSGDRIFLVRASPDGRWLVSQTLNGAGNAIGYYFWQTDDWKPAYSIPAQSTTALGLAYRPDGREMAMSINLDETILADPSDGREIVRLATSPVERAAPMCYSHDGQRLLLTAYPDTVQVWNLEPIRRRLEELGLNWENDSRTPRAPAEPRKPIRFMVDAGDVSTRPLRLRSSKPTKEAISIADPADEPRPPSHIDDGNSAPDPCPN